MSNRALVYGVAVAGAATARALAKRGYDLVVVDDAVTPQKQATVSDLGCDLIARPSTIELAALVSACDLVAPSPGVPETHPVIALARDKGVPLRSELDLAYEWESTRVGGARPTVAVTGTDGKTTTVLMAQAILQASGRRSVACGNTEIPFVEAIELDVDSFVVEATSFRLAFAESFRCSASAWLNLAPDHLDWHVSMESYESAKAKLWANVREGDVAIGLADEPIVMQHLRRCKCRQVTVGVSSGTYRLEDGILMSPMGPILDSKDMFRTLPHDLTNALVASALVVESGQVGIDELGSSLAEFRPPKHRIEFLLEHAGVRYFDDSKATTPHAAVTAMRGFESIVLIAGGRNKDLDLSHMSGEGRRLRAVVLIGEASEELARVFAGIVDVEAAASMEEAVNLAASKARPGDVVLLSPGCTSLDWYSGYSERGDDFARCVRRITGNPVAIQAEVTR